MEPFKVEHLIDSKIYKSLCDGDSYAEIIKYLEEKISRFKEKPTYINVSKKYLLRNWELLPIRQKYITYQVIYSTKRLHDCEWIVKNQIKFPRYQRSKMFNLVQLKDKLSPSISLEC